MPGDSMDREEYDEVVEEVTGRPKPEKPPARVLPFPQLDVEDDGVVN